VGAIAGVDAGDSDDKINDAELQIYYLVLLDANLPLNIFIIVIIVSFSY